MSKVMTRRKRRLIFLGFCGVVAAIATALVIYALGDATLYFYTPSEAKERAIPAGQVINLGGLVADGSVRKLDGLKTQFKITDGKDEITVTYGEDLPDLFREGQGVIATGVLTGDGSFSASRVLAKHDEKYMPPEVEKSLKDKGYWKPKVGNP